MNYGATAASATAMIKRFGTKCRVTPASLIDYYTYIVFMPAKKEQKDGTYVLSSSKEAYMIVNAQKPAPGDKVKVGSEEYIVDNAESFRPDGLTDLYFKVALTT